MGRLIIFAIIFAAVAFGLGTRPPATPEAADNATVTVAANGEQVVRDPFFDAARPKVVAAAIEEAARQSSGGPRVLAGGGTVLKRQPDGHFYASAMVEGRTIRFMIDTGATGIALTGADARALGRSWSDGDLETVGRGVSGEVMGKSIQLANVSVGDKRVDNIRAVVIPTGLDVSLLGQSFLSQIGQVTITGDEMRLN